MKKSRRIVRYDIKQMGSQWKMFRKITQITVDFDQKEDILSEGEELVATFERFSDASRFKNVMNIEEEYRDDKF